MLFPFNDLRNKFPLRRIKILLECIPNVLDSLLLFFTSFYLTTWGFSNNVGALKGDRNNSLLLISALFIIHLVRIKSV